jgi:hypothetical protein
MQFGTGTLTPLIIDYKFEFGHSQGNADKKLVNPLGFIPRPRVELQPRRPVPDEKDGPVSGVWVLGIENGVECRQWHLGEVGFVGSCIHIQGTVNDACRASDHFGKGLMSPLQFELCVRAQ